MSSVNEQEELEACRRHLEQLKASQSKSLAEIFAAHAECTWPVSYLEMASKLQIEPFEVPMQDGNASQDLPSLPEPEEPPEASLNDLLMDLPVDLQMLIFTFAGAWRVPGGQETLAPWSVCRSWKRLIWRVDGFIAQLAQIIVGYEGRNAAGKSAADVALLRLCQSGEHMQWWHPVMTSSLHLLIKAVLNLGARADVDHGLALCNAIRSLNGYHIKEVVQILLTTKHPARANSSGSLYGFKSEHIRGKTELISILKLRNSGAQPGYGLVLAAQKGNTEIARLLLEWPVYAPRADCFRVQAFRSAARGGHLETLQLLVSKWPKPYRRRHKRSKRLKRLVMIQSAIEAVCAGPKAHKILQWMLTQGETDPDMPKADVMDGLLLVTVASAGHLETAKLLLSWISNPPRADCQDGAALIKAAGKGHIDLVMLLLSQSENAARADCQDGEALIAAVKGRHLTTMRLLLSWPMNAPKANVRDGACLLAACSLENPIYSEEPKPAVLIQLLLEWPRDACRADCQEGLALLRSCRSIKEGRDSGEEKRLEVLFSSKYPPKANCFSNLCLAECSYQGLSDSATTLVSQPSDAAVIDDNNGWMLVRMCEGLTSAVNKTMNKLRAEDKSTECTRDGHVFELERNMSRFYRMARVLLSGNQDFLTWVEVNPEACSLCCQGGQALHILKDMLVTSIRCIVEWIGSPVGQRPPDRSRMPFGKKIATHCLCFCGHLINFVDDSTQKVDAKLSVAGREVVPGLKQIVRIDYGPTEDWFRAEPYTFEDFKKDVQAERENFDMICGLMNKRLELGSLQAYENSMRDQLHVQG